MEEKMLSRKQRRKLERQNKKAKMDTFYKNRKMNQKRKNSNLSNNSDSAKERKKLSKYNKKKDLRKEKAKEKKVPFDEKDDLEKELEYLEGKLGLSKEENMKALSKRYTLENHDPDILDFLDNIDRVVGEDIQTYEKEKNLPLSKSKKNTSKKKQTEIHNEEEENEDDEEIDSDEVDGQQNEGEEDEEDEEEEEEEEEDKKEEITKNKNNKKSQTKLAKPKIITKEAKPKKSQITQRESSEEVQKFEKEVRSLVNKIAESNISFLMPDLLGKIEAFKKSQKNNFTMYDIITKTAQKLLLNQEITNLPITSCVCTFISLFHYKEGNEFFYYYLKQLFTEVEYFTSEEVPKHKVKNAIFQIIHFYLFGNINSKLIYDLIKFFIENFTENNSEYLLLILSYTGIEIRKENPENLTEIISQVTKQYNNMKMENSTNLSKIKYIVDMIDDIKHNKYLKFNLNEKFSFFKNFVNKNSSTSIKVGDTIETDIKTIEKMNTEEIISGDFENKEESEKQDFDLDDFVPDDAVDEKTNKLLESKMKKLNISTQLKRMIFTAIATASDVNDAFERLMRLNLKKEQSREIIKIIVQLCSEEKCYNPFYKILLDKLIMANKDHKYTFHYCIWDYMKIFKDFDDSELKKIHNLSKLTAKLLVSERISLPVLLHFEFENSDEKTTMFVIFLLDFYFAESTVAKTKILFAKLVKNDSHVEFAKRLCLFLTRDFINEIDVSKKSEAYQENFAAANSVLKKIL